MSDYETLVADLIARYPHLVMEVSGPWRDRTGTIDPMPWVCNFKNASLSLQMVHPGSCGATTADALRAGLEHLDAHADDPKIKDYDRADRPTP
jgi:hypothetical protein